MSENKMYVRYSEELEETQPDEAETIREIVAAFGRMRQMVFEKHRHGHRDAHAKSHGILRGELIINEGLPEELAQGLFREARTYPVIARFSTAPGDILPDGVSSFRGLAIKVIGVEGEKVLPEERDALTQDFLFFNHPVLPTGDPAAYLKQQLLLEQVAKAPEEMQKAGSTVARTANSVVEAVGGELKPDIIGSTKPETHLAGETYFTGSPIRYGDYVAKVRVAPDSYSLNAVIGQTLDTSNPSVLRDAVVDFFRVHEAEYTVGIQLCTDLKTMPIEDVSVEWPEDQSPYQVVGRLIFPAQEAYSPARRVYGDDALSFNPWHCLPEHRPLSAIQRARRAAYDTSAKFRHDMNARPRVEPRSIDELPD